MNTPERAMLQALLNTFKGIPEARSDAEAMGLVMGRFFHWDGLNILRAAQAALEDANLHTEAGVVGELADALVKVSDDQIIDRETRTALFAALGEVYPGIGKDRARRLAKLNLLAGRDADNPITSLSDAYGDMTVGDAGRVFEMLHEMRELMA